MAEKYPFKIYSVDEGLPATMVQSILQDRYGYLWFGTYGGACKFDGRTFITYTSADGLGSNVVRGMLLDREGNLWFGTHNGGASRFDGGKWITYTAENSGLVHNYVWRIYEDSKGNFWFGTIGGGVSRFDGSSWLKYTEADGLVDDRVRAICEDHYGNFWFGGQQNGAFRFDGENWMSINDVLSNRGIKFGNVGAILEDSEGNIWIGGIGQSMYQPVSTLLVKLTGAPESGEYTVFTDLDGLPPGAVRTIIEDSNGNIWVASEGVGIFDGVNWKIYTKENGLPVNDIWSIFEDKEGNIWLGTGSGGIVKFSSPEFTTYTEEDGLAINSTIPALEDSKGNIWFLHNQGGNPKPCGVSRFDGSKWSIFTTEDGLAGDRILQILEDRKNNLWFATERGVSKFDGLNWTTFSKNEGLISAWIENLYEDRQGNLWFFTAYGLERFDGKNWVAYGYENVIHQKHIFQMTEDDQGNFWFAGDAGILKFDGNDWQLYDSVDGIALDDVRGLLRDKSGGIWFAGAKGLFLMSSGKWMAYTPEDGLAHTSIETLFQDSSGIILIGTNGGGVSAFDGRSFTNYTTAQGLSNDNCYSIFQDDRYHYFVTDKGLNRFDGANFKVYTSKDGLAATQLWGALKDSQGNFWFGSNEGVTKFNPRAVRANTVPPPVYITRLRISERDTTVASGLELSHDKNNLRIDYIGLCYTAPEDVVYQSKLEGLDQAWVETNTTYAIYPYLPPGAYMFKVKARNNDGLWNEKPALFSFTILPPFWATYWFRGSTLLFALGLIWGIHDLRLRYVKRRNLELGWEIAERKKAEAALRLEHTEVERLKNCLQAENIYLREEIKIEHNFEEIISRSEAFNQVLKKVEEVASTDATVLILGETGTGKQLIARAIHSVSPRGEGPLVTVNCAALPANLIESELFGHEKGAFTGALALKIGRFELAHGGSIFLDEIGELPLELQAKLLRVLQDGEFERLGSSKTVKVDVRIIAASNRDLEREGKSGRFREDLFYRLNVYPIKCPPLRERKEDIPLLVNHFVNKYSERLGKQIKSVPQHLMESLLAYDWPGNVRELENVVERGVIISRTEQLELGEWFPVTPVSPPGSKPLSTLEKNEREHIIKALEMTGWRVSGEMGAAKILNINPKTLQSRIKKLGIRRYD